MNNVLPELAKNLLYEPLYVKESNSMKLISLSWVIFRVKLHKLK